MTMETSHLYEGDFKGLRVGLCQILTEQWAVEENLGRTIEAIESAGQKGAEIAVTPECVLHGYAESSSDNFHERLREIAEPIDGKNLQLICAKAKELNIHVMVGFAELGDDARIYNSAAFISNRGEIINVYRKVHCRDFERADYHGLFTPGDEFMVAGVRLDEREFKIGTMICFDREIPETVRCLRGLGAEMVLCPLATNTSDMTKFVDGVDNEIITRCRATENEVYIVVVNHSGRFNGGSFVVGPSGQLLLQMGSEPDVEVIDIPVEVVQKRFHSNPLGWMGWGYRRQQVYAKYLK